jgi:two-component system chemotaxis response regulator CheB
MVKQAGGVAVVQDPREAVYTGMPGSALKHVAVDHVLPVADIARLLVRLATAPADETPDEKGGDIVTEHASDPVDVLQDAAMRSGRHDGPVAPYSCPECGGTLWELGESGHSRFRCRVGHAFTADSLLVAQDEALESALWVALRALEENAAFLRRVAENSMERRPNAAARFSARAAETERHALVLGEALLSVGQRIQYDAEDVQEPRKQAMDDMPAESQSRAKTRRG